MRSFDQLTAQERQLKALELRRTGMQYALIAEALGYADPAGAFKAAMSALKRATKEPADAVREMELARLDGMLHALQDKIAAADTRAIDTALRIMDRRARFLGLDAPQSIDVTTKGEPFVTRIEIAPAPKPAD